MDYLIYYDIANAVTSAGMVKAVNGISEKLYHWPRIIKVENSWIFERTSNDMCECLHDFFLSGLLDKADEVYIYYWSVDTMGVWRLKKNGCMKMNLVHCKPDCLDISLGAKLGILDKR